jgi:hypothetical protein
LALPPTPDRPKPKPKPRLRPKPKELLRPLEDRRGSSYSAPNSLNDDLAGAKATPCPFPCPCPCPEDSREKDKRLKESLSPPPPPPPRLRRTREGPRGMVAPVGEGGTGSPAPGSSLAPANMLEMRLARTESS